MMLTRFKQLYNGLTYSEAYNQKTGKYDYSKINRKTFTPHNLRALLIGYNGAVMIHYVSHAGRPLVETIKFKTPLDGLNQNSNQYVKWYDDNLREKRPLIDALWFAQGLKFNYIEEVYFFGAGFDEQELMKETQGLDAFLGNPQIRSSLKRLERIATVLNAPITNEIVQMLTDYYKTEKFNKNLVPLFKKLEDQYKINSVELSPDRTELGLHLQPGLDSSKYELDAAYIPDSNNKENNSEKCRLSRYFYLEEVHRKEELKNKANEEKKPSVEPTSQKQESHSNTPKGYVSAMKALGYKEIRDDIEFIGKTNMFSKTLNWLSKSCTEKVDKATGYKYRTCQMYADLLKEKGVMNTKDANIWSSDIFSKDADLEFRVFVKENQYGFDVVIKLPIGLNSFVFSNTDALALLYSNTNSNKGKTFQCSIMDSPEIKSLAATHNIDCVYDAVEFTLVKDLAGFGKSSWLLLDYLKACKGEKNVYSQMGQLPLGNKIVVGVKPNSLKAEIFDCSGQYQTSGLICGQAGSGKSALMDSLVIQFLALKGNMGNGAVVLMDAKQEWPPLWKAVFDSKGIPFYGFDGRPLSNQESLKKRNVSDTGKVTISGFKETVTQEVGGMVFIMGLYSVIQDILSKAGVKDIKSFNKNNCNVDGITRLPRIAIFIDEMNTFAVNASKGSVAQAIMPLIVGGANLTRTAGYMWFLCGQDIPKSIVSSEKRGSFKYNIMGTMPSERFDYFNVSQNPNVVDYEDKHRTSENAHPIMKQGTFYAGPAGQTELVRSMFLPDEEKTTALDVLNETFEGMYELDAVVKYGLRHNLFDNFTGGVKAKNNIIFAVLRDLGVISEAEFQAATDRIFAEDSQDKSSISSDFWSDEDKSNDNDNSDNNGFAEGGQQQGSKGSQNNPPIPSQGASQHAATSSNQRTNTNSERQGKIVYPTQIPISNDDPLYNQKVNKAQIERNNAASGHTVYNKSLHVEENPFQFYNPDSTMSTLFSIKDMSKILEQDIETNICPKQMITSFAVQNGQIYINNIAYLPTFEDSLLMSLPLSIRDKIAEGQLAEFFNLHTVRKYKNLEQLLLLDGNLAQGRARKEMGIGFRKKWSVLFKKLKHLQYIQVGNLYYTRENPDTKVEEPLLERFKIEPKLTYGSKVKGSGDHSIMNKVWDFAPVRIMARSLGWTAASTMVWGAASFFGPVGMLFAAFALAGTYKEVKKNLPQKSSSQKGFTNNSTGQKSK